MNKISGLTYGRIEGKDEKNALGDLIIRVYSAEGHRDPTEHSSPFEAYLSRESTVMFGAYHNGVPVGTLSLVPDSDGVPMNSIFSEELKVIREAGMRFGEACQFAVDRPFLAERCPEIVDTEVSISLLSLLCQEGIREGYDGFCLVVNPKHAAFYRQVGCKEIGEEKPYASVNNAPAVPFFLDLTLVRNPPEWVNNFILREIITRVRASDSDHAMLAEKV